MPELQWYFGLGAQYRWWDLEYAYISESPGAINELKKYELNGWTFGPEAALGIEYSHPDMPISSFFEVEGYVDVWTYPGWFRFSAGVGLRYNF